MKEKNQIVLITILLLIVTIVILELTVKRDKVSSILPVAVKMEEKYSKDVNEIDIYLLNINSTKRTAKMVNKEIDNLFLSKINKVISDKETYAGKFNVKSDFSLRGNILSLKIYMSDTSVKDSAGEIYAINYDMKNDCVINLANELENRNISYDEIMNTAITLANLKIESIYTAIPYYYIYSNGDLELIIRSINKMDDETYWNGILTYKISAEVINNEKRKMNNDTENNEDNNQDNEDDENTKNDKVEDINENKMLNKS